MSPFLRRFSKISAGSSGTFISIDKLENSVVYFMVIDKRFGKFVVYNYICVICETLSRSIKLKPEMQWVKGLKLYFDTSIFNFAFADRK